MKGSEVRALAGPPTLLAKVLNVCCLYLQPPQKKHMPAAGGEKAAFIELGAELASRRRGGDGCSHRRLFVSVKEC